MCRVLAIGSVAAALWFATAQCIDWVDFQNKREAHRVAEQALTDKINQQIIDDHFANPPLMEMSEDDWIAQQNEERERMIQSSKKCFKVRDCSRLAEVAYFEDRGGGVEGMQAVVNVVLNRVNGDSFPHTISGVIYQKRQTKNGVVCQFSYVCELKDRRMRDQESKYKAGFVAWQAYRGKLEDTTNGADHYYNPAKVSRTPRFAIEYQRVAVISDHVFYRSL